MKKLLGFIIITLALTLLTGCPAIKPFARTALEAARHACAVYADQTGVTFEDVCKTEEQLRPFIDSILAAQQAASAGATGSCTCPECPTASVPNPEEKKAPETPPAPATADPAPTPVPETK